MPLFSSSSPFDHDIEKATDENNTSEDWAVIMEICDKVGTTPNGPKDCLRSIVKRLNHAVPNVTVQSLTVLDACINNCGKSFHLEVASRDFENEIKKLLNGKLHPKAAEKLKQLLKKWSEGDFKSDSQLSLIPSLYNQLKSDGLDFTNLEVKKTVTTFSKDPNVVQSQQEEADIAKAIELSLKENQTSPPKSSRMYPTARPPSPTPQKELRKVQAIYDFEAAEDNELSFKEGEIIQVLDDGDPNWWKGTGSRGEGLFPANFVTADLNTEREQYKIPEKKAVQFNEVVEVKTLEADSLPVEADEEKIDRLLHLLHEADPTGERPDGEEMLSLEDQCHAMGPLLDQELEKIDKKHAALTRLSHELMESLSLYHSLMREYPMPPPQSYAYPSPKGMPPYQYASAGPVGAAPNIHHSEGPAPQHFGQAPQGYSSMGPGIPYPMMGPMQGHVHQQPQGPMSMPQAVGPQHMTHQVMEQQQMPQNSNQPPESRAALSHAALGGMGSMPNMHYSSPPTAVYPIQSVNQYGGPPGMMGPPMQDYGQAPQKQHLL